MSWINPEKKLLQKFLNLQLLCTSDDISPNPTNESFPSLIHAEITTLRSVNKDSGSLLQMAYESIDIIGLIQGLSGKTCYIDPLEKPFHRVIRPLYEKCFTDLEMSLLEQVYQSMYPHNASLHLSRFYKEFKTLVVNGDEYVSLKSRSQTSSAIIAHWPSINGSVDTMGETPCKVGLIESFIHHQIKMADSTMHKNILLAPVKWF